MSLELVLSWIAIITMGNIIPGPDFIYVSTVSATKRKFGLVAALGLQTGVL